MTQILSTYTSSPSSIHDYRSSHCFRSLRDSFTTRQLLLTSREGARAFTAIFQISSPLRIFKHDDWDAFRRIPMERDSLCGQFIRKTGSSPFSNSNRTRKNKWVERPNVMSVLSTKITRNSRIDPSFKDSPRKPLRFLWFRLNQRFRHGHDCYVGWWQIPRDWRSLRLWRRGANKRRKYFSPQIDHFVESRFPFSPPGLYPEPKLCFSAKHFVGHFGSTLLVVSCEVKSKIWSCSRLVNRACSKFT